MEEYLPQDSTLRAGLEVMDQEFGDVHAGVLHVMFEGLEEAEKLAIYEQFLEIDLSHN